MLADDTLIHLHQMIIHQVDHRRFAEPQYSNLESPLDAPVEGFLQRHILRSKSHKNTKDALFVEPDARLINTRLLCDDILSDPNNFVPLSQSLAEQLFLAMQSSRASRVISPGNLVVCTYSEDGANAPRHLALLKMDPKDGFYGERVEVQPGQFQTVLRHVTGVLPIIDDELESGLQKAALILPEAERSAELHLRILDEQSKARGRQQPVASFFQVGFLQSRVDFNPDVSVFKAFESKRAKIKGEISSAFRIVHQRSAGGFADVKPAFAL